MSTESYAPVVFIDKRDEGSSLSSRRGVAILLLLSLVQFMDVLDASIMNIALPSIKDDLGFSQQSLLWVVNGYILTYGGFLLLGGRMADLLGRGPRPCHRLLVFAGSSLTGGRVKGVAAADATQLVALAGFLPMFFFLTLYMQTVLGYSPIQTGIATCR